MAIVAACQEPRIQNWVPAPVPYPLADAREFSPPLSDAGWAAGTYLVCTIRIGAHLAGVLKLPKIVGAGAP